MIASHAFCFKDLERRLKAALDMNQRMICWRGIFFHFHFCCVSFAILWILELYRRKILEHGAVNPLQNASNQVTAFASAHTGNYVEFTDNCCASFLISSFIRPRTFWRSPSLFFIMICSKCPSFCDFWQTAQRISFLVSFARNNQ